MIDDLLLVLILSNNVEIELNLSIFFKFTLKIYALKAIVVGPDIKINKIAIREDIVSP